jgi:hypothetical protein
MCEDSKVFENLIFPNFKTFENSFLPELENWKNTVLYEKKNVYLIKPLASSPSTLPVDLREGPVPYSEIRLEEKKLLKLKYKQREIWAETNEYVPIERIILYSDDLSLRHDLPMLKCKNAKL